MIVYGLLRLVQPLRRGICLRYTSAMSNSQMDHAMIRIAENNSTHGEQDLERLASIDRGFAGRVVIAASEKHQRIVCSPTGSLHSDTDDVRKVAAAAGAGALAAFGMGASRITMNIAETIPRFQHPIDGASYKHAVLVAELAARQSAAVPLQALEAKQLHASPLSEILVEEIHGFMPPKGRAEAIECGRKLARDIGSPDPERMAPPRVADHVAEACRGAGIHVQVIEDQSFLAAEYPLLMAVARASLPVVRHQPRVVRLSWSGSGPVERTVCIAGKGVTYDTGGADLKISGSMSGMRMDKCGAAAAAGFILALAKAPENETKGLRVIVELGCVRNSIGSDAYVADEIITGHAGKRVLVGNTDAEGRMVLADCLSHLRERVVSNIADYPNPTFLSIATLTGHALRSYGPYAVAIDNGAARRAGGVAQRIAAAGAALGQPLEVSSLRKEDYAYINPGSQTALPGARGIASAFDVVQANNAASAITIRAHQFPMAFLDIASGLQDHDASSQHPIPYCHIDLAGSIMDGRGVETGSPIVPLYGHFVMRLSEHTSRM